MHAQRSFRRVCLWLPRRYAPHRLGGITWHWAVPPEPKGIGPVSRGTRGLSTTWNDESYFVSTSHEYGFLRVPNRP